MILVALGANLPSEAHGAPVATLSAAIAALAGPDVLIGARSRWFETAPVPISDQPWYVNGVLEVVTALAPADLMARLHRLEAAFGRVRGVINGPRAIDLDLLCYDDRIEATWPILPHPRLHERAFVLLPLLDVAPDWRHPVTGRPARELLAEVDPAQVTRPFDAKAYLT